MSEFQVLTLNVRVDLDEEPNRWKDRFPRITKLIAAVSARGLRPDIIGLQELRPDTMNDVAGYFGAHGYDHYWQQRGGRHDWGSDEGVGLLWRRSRFAALNQGSFAMSPEERRRAADCDAHDGQTHLENRNCIWVRFQDRTSSKTFKVYNTHFSYDPCQSVGCARIMAKEIANRSFADDPVVAMGDLNFGMNSDGRFDAAYLTLCQDAGLANSYLLKRNAVEDRSDCCTENSNFQNRRDGRMIDHILVSPQIEICDATIDRTLFTADGLPVPCATLSSSGQCENTTYAADQLFMYSDHWAVMATLAL